MDYRQNNWLELLVIAKFAVNNKIHTATKIFLFIANNKRELRTEADIRRKENIVKIIKKVQDKARVVLKKAQKERKRQADRKKKV